jgi:hypothetical protein
MAGAATATAEAKARMVTIWALRMFYPSAPQARLRIPLFDKAKALSLCRELDYKQNVFIGKLIQII